MAEKTAKGAPKKKDYRCDSCGEPVLYKGRGKPAKFCPQCKAMTEKKQASIDPIGVPVTPPDVPQPTILAKSSPKLMEVSSAPDPWGTLKAAAGSLGSDDEVTTVERRITLLARYIMEATLWDAIGLSKKERFDAAVSAIKTIEGTKSNVWTKDPEKDKHLPQSQKLFFAEKEAVSKRIQALLKERDKINDPDIKAAAQQLTAIEKGTIEEGEA